MQYDLLAASDVWKTIGSVILAILILLVMITIHEFGHYLAGKIFHFKINEFSIGFGPAVFKHKRKKSEEQFSIRLIPLGGYCAFEGEDGDDQVLDEKGRPVKDENGQPVKKEPHPDSFMLKKPWQRIIVLIAGAFMNYVLALVLIMINFFSYGQTMLAVYETEQSTEIPVEYCLQDKDILLEAEGSNLYLTTDLIRHFKGKKAGDLVEFRVSRIVSVDENGKNVREEQTVKVMLRSDVGEVSSADLDGIWQSLGVKYETEGDYVGYQLANASYRFGFFETLGRSFLYSFKIAGAIFQVIGELLTGALGLSALGGPVTTIRLTSQIASRSFKSFLEIASYIGVNLAVFNLLPIPALDGSKVLFTAIEWVRGKPINRKVEAILNTLGLVLLLGFAILVDVLQLFV